MDITSPLCRGQKIKLKGGDRRWVSFRYEQLPNFYYWCGCLDHMEKDCDIGLQHYVSSTAMEHQYGTWLRAGTDQPPRKTVIIVMGWQANMTSREPPKPTNHTDEEKLTALDQNQPSMLCDQTISVAGEESPMDVEEIIMGQSSTQPRPVNLENFEAQLREIDEAINYIPMQKVSVLHN